MKKLLVVLALMVVFTSCTSSNEFGKCIGVFSDEQPNLNYEVSIKNAIVGVIFSETLVVPAIVLAKQTYCPVGVK